jgi:hypothetical protein
MSRAAIALEHVSPRQNEIGRCTGQGADANRQREKAAVVQIVQRKDSLHERHVHASGSASGNNVSGRSDQKNRRAIEQEPVGSKSIPNDLTNGHYPVASVARVN